MNMPFAPLMWGFVFERAWLFFLLVPLVLLLIAAHLFRARRKDVRVPSLLPWRSLKAQDVAGPRRKRKVSPLLLLQILFVAATVTAAAGPGCRSATRTRSALFVLLDRSAGMAAPSPRGGSRMEAARKAVLDVHRSRPDRPRVLLRCFPPHSEGDIEVAPDELEKRLESIRVAQVPGTLAAALAQTGFLHVQEVLGLLAVSDGTGPEVTLPENGRAELVGGPLENIGIEAFSVETLADHRVRIFLRVRNTGSRDAVVPVSVSAGDRPLGEPAPLEVKAGESRGRVLFPEGIALRPGEILAVRLAPGDAFPLDDCVFASPEAMERWSVVLAGTDAPYLSRFLRSDPAVELTDMRVSQITPDMSADLFIFHQKVPASRPRGSVSLVVDPLEDFWGLSVSRKRGKIPLASDPDLDRASPGLSRVRFDRVGVLSSLPEGSKRIVRSGDDAVVVRIPGEDAPDFWFVGLPVDDASSPWPLTPWFPVFWKRLLKRASPTGTGAFGYGFHRAGETVRFPFTEGGKVLVTNPDDDPVRLVSAERTLSFVPERAGLYRLQDRAGARHTWAVNLLSPEESDLDGRDETRGRLPEAPVGKIDGVRSLRGWAAGAALAVLLWILLAEGMKARRLLAPFALILLLIPPACGSSDPPAPESAKPLSPGTPLPDPGPGRDRGKPFLCKTCGKLAGPGHKCGVSAWCDRCGCEASLEDHVCGVSRFCPDCGREAALAGHRCGRTRFCPVCKMEVSLSHSHEDKEGGWGKIR